VNLEKGLGVVALGIATTILLSTKGCSDSARTRPDQEATSQCAPVTVEKPTETTEKPRLPDTVWRTFEKAPAPAAKSARVAPVASPAAEEEVIVIDREDFNPRMRCAVPWKKKVVKPAPQPQEKAVP
jgi:hypothetical protein